MGSLSFECPVLKLKKYGDGNVSPSGLFMTIVDVSTQIYKYALHCTNVDVC